MGPVPPSKSAEATTAARQKELPKLLPTISDWKKSVNCLHHSDVEGINPPTSERTTLTVAYPD